MISDINVNKYNRKGKGLAYMAGLEAVLFKISEGGVELSSSVRNCKCKGFIYCHKAVALRAFVMP